MFCIFKGRAPRAFGVFLKVVALHDLTDGGESSEPFGNPQCAIEAEFFDGFLAGFPIDAEYKFCWNFSALAPVFEDLCRVGVVIQGGAVPCRKLPFINPQTPTKGMLGIKGCYFGVCIIPIGLSQAVHLDIELAPWVEEMIGHVLVLMASDMSVCPHH
jgi:hypothetical protein